MRTRIAQTRNLRLLAEAGQALATRSPGLPGIGLVWGATGYGKTTAASWFRNASNAVYVRAYATWTPSAMLGAICRELDSVPQNRCSAMVDFIVEQLALRGRPLIVDEADYLLSSKKLLETLRDLHDVSTSPLIVIGMADFRRKVASREQFAGRIAQTVEFRAADLSDARVLADTVCEVAIADDLLERLHRASQGSMRLLAKALEERERAAKRQGLTKVTLSDCAELN